jgi:replicative DNA helicase
MITESFINSCFTLLLNKNCKVKKTKSLYKDILAILKFCESKETIEIPLMVKNKLDALKILSGQLLDGRSIENVIDSISLSEKYKQYKDYLDVKINEDIKESQFQDIIRQIRLRKKINALFQNYDQLSEVLESIKDGSFDSIDDLVQDYEVTIKKLYSNMMESNRIVSIEATSSLDLVKDNYENVKDMIVRKYDKSNRTPTGFELLDKEIMNGGFEPSRLYIFGGGSGAGKSTLMNNMIIRAATIPPLPLSKITGKRAFLYITLENTIEESLMRTYQPMFEQETNDMLVEISQGVDIKHRICEALEKSNSTIIMKYFPAMSVSPLDLTGVIDEVVEEYGQNNVAGVYIDYLDLLKPDNTKYDMYRLDLGQIALSLKTLGVQYNLPIITLSQLGRQVYKVTESKELGLDLMSESIKKVENADFVGLMAANKFNSKLVHGRIGKNRSGRSNISLDFTVNFKKFKFISITYSTKNEDETGNEVFVKKGDQICKIKASAFGGLQI